MTLDTTIFQYANSSLEETTPADWQHTQWVPADFKWIPTNFNKPFANHAAIAQDVYRHLVMYEDLNAINDGTSLDQMVLIETWLARVYRDAPREWQTLFKTALNEPQEYNEGFENPYYHQPSLWFLHKDWMHDNACDFVVEEIPSITFRKESVPVTDRLVYPSQEFESVTAMILRSSHQEIVTKLKEGEIVYLNIPEELIEMFSAEERRELMEALSVEQLAELIQEDKIEDDDIPHDKYAAVYAEVRQK